MKFYIECDEVYHEDDLKKIKNAMKKYENNKKVEALVVNFYHFYGNANSFLDSPGWYRSEARIIKNSIRTYAPDGLFWLVLDDNKKGRYPFAKKIDAHCYHYGWVRSEEKMNLKSKNVKKYWGGVHTEIDYSKIDQTIIKEFKGKHPELIKSWLPKEKGIFRYMDKSTFNFNCSFHVALQQQESMPFICPIKVLLYHLKYRG